MLMPDTLQRTEQYTSPTPLLTTKLYIPLPRPNMVFRSRVVERLEAGLSQGRRLTLVSAPAGFGKTTLLSEWVAQTAAPVTWLSLDQEDNDPFRFLIYLVAALQSIKANVGTGCLDALNSLQPPPLESILTGLINELVTIPDPFALILDDYHVIETTSIHQALNYLIEHLPPQVHLVITSRVDPPLPLARLRTRNQLIEIRAADLRFNRAETATFLNRTVGLDLSVEEVAALETRTEGWVAGLQLASLSMQGKGRAFIADFVSAFGGSHRHVIDYLAEEVIAQQPVEIHDFLCQTSILDRLTAPLCDAVTGGNNSAAILRQLERDNLFLIQLDDARQWYRYHRLFADFLHSHLHQDMADCMPELHQRACIWYEQAGLVPAAISHAGAAKDFERAADLIERAIEPTMMRSEVMTVLGWLNALPDEVMHARPLLCIYHALTLLFHGQPLEIAEARLQAADRADTAGNFAGEMAVLRAFIATCQGDTRQTIESSQHALELLPDESVFFRTLVLAYLGLASLFEGDVAKATRAFEDTARGGQQAGNLTITVMALCRLGHISMIQGQFYQAEKFFKQALESALDDRGRPRPVAGIPIIGLGLLLYEWNDLEAASRHLQEGIELAKIWSEIASMQGYIGLAFVRQAQNDPAGSNRAIRTARRLAEKFDAMEMDDISVAAYQAQLWIRQDNLEAALGWVEQRKLDCDAGWQELKEGATDGSLPFLRAHEYISLARVYVTQQRFEEAKATLDLLLRRAKSAEWVWYSIEILILQALVHHRQGDTLRALSALENAISEAEPGGFVRMFVNEGGPMAELLRQLVARGRAIDYGSKLLAALSMREAGKETKPGEIKAQPLVEPLSERELEVLRLVAAGFSNREIATELVVAISTAKTHLNNIYRKLDVSSRTQAVARARALNLM